MELITFFAAGGVDISALPNIGNGGSFVTDVITIVIRIVAALCLLFIVIGGFRYILSQGDPGGVSKAKGTIVYALIGLVITILAQFIVAMIVEAVK